MKFDSNEPGSRSGTLRILMGCMTALAAVVVVLGTVLLVNKDRLAPKDTDPGQSVVKTEEDLAREEAESVSSSGIVSDDLDFWHMYDQEEEPAPPVDEYFPEEEEESPALSRNSVSVDGLVGAEAAADAVLDHEERTVSFNAGTREEPEMVDIDPDILQNSYSAGAFRKVDGILEYFSNNRKISTCGVDVSKYQGNIDWSLVAADHIDFAMIRMGVRGYSSGQVMTDEQFDANMQGALANGIEVGVYFYSQAINTNEAVEEANYAVAAMQGYQQNSLPVVFYTEAVPGEVSRTDSLTPEELTDIAITFCDTVRSYGFKPMIAGNKKRLTVEMEPSRLAGYDIWLIDSPHIEEGESLTLSEYPYTYSMWQYSSEGTIGGIEGPVDKNICFVDFKYR